MPVHFLDVPIIGGVTAGLFAAPASLFISCLLDRRRFLYWKHYALWPIGKRLISSFQICCVCGSLGLVIGSTFLIGSGVAVTQAVLSLAELFGMMVVMMSVLSLFTRLFSRRGRSGPA